MRRRAAHRDDIGHTGGRRASRWWHGVCGHSPLCQRPIRFHRHDLLGVHRDIQAWAEAGRGVIHAHRANCRPVTAGSAAPADHITIGFHCEGFIAGGCQGHDWLQVGWFPPVGSRSRPYHSDCPSLNFRARKNVRTDHGAADRAIRINLIAHRPAALRQPTNRTVGDVQITKPIPKQQLARRIPHACHPAQRGAVIIGHADLIDTPSGMIDWGERQARLRGTRNDRAIA